MPSVVISPPFSPHFHSFIIHILPPRSPPLFLCVLLSFAFFSSLSLTPLHPSDSPLCSKKPFLNSSVRSDPFHQPEKSQLSAFLWLSLFYHSHGGFMTVLLTTSTLYIPAHTHTLYPHPHMQQTIHAHRRGETWEACIWRFRCLCLHGVRFVCQVTNNDSRSNKSRGIQVHHLEQPWEAVGCTLVNQQYIKTALSQE